MPASEATDPSAQACYQQGLKLLAHREHAPAELAIKLAQRGYPAEVVEPVLQQLQQAGALDLNRYIEAYIRSRAQRGYGPRRIAVELKQRGVAADSIQQGLQVSEVDWSQVAAAFYQKQFGRLKPAATLNERLKRQQQLRLRGFESEQIDGVFNPTISNLNSEPRG